VGLRGRQGPFSHASNLVHQPTCARSPKACCRLCGALAIRKPVGSWRPATTQLGEDPRYEPAQRCSRCWLCCGPWFTVALQTVFRSIRAGLMGRGHDMTAPRLGRHQPGRKTDEWTFQSALGLAALPGFDSCANQEIVRFARARCKSFNGVPVRLLFFGQAAGHHPTAPGFDLGCASACPRFSSRIQLPGRKSQRACFEMRACSLRAGRRGLRRSSCGAKR